MSATPADTLLSHWSQRVAGVQQSSDEFYAAVDRLLRAQLPDLKIERVNIHEGGLLSAKREYLQVRRREHVFHICAAPFGDGFFVSWYLGETRSGFLALLTRVPYCGLLVAWIADQVKPLTYYRFDTALMFQSVTHEAVLAAIDNVTTDKGVRGLTEDERKPVMRDIFAQFSGA